MIVTVTLNPSLDRTIEVGSLERGQVQRVTTARLDPGGKGVNVARALLANGVAARAVVPIAGAEGDQLVGLLEKEGVDVAVVPIPGRTRSNTAIAEADGTVTKLNEPGPTLGGSDLDALAAQVLAAAEPGSWVALCGSLPPGVPDDVYATLARRFTASGLRVAVDTSGPAFRAAIAAGPELVKPNDEELAEAVGRPLVTLSDVITAARDLQTMGARTVLVSRGAAGAVLVDDDVLVGESTVSDPRSTVGAGDAFLAGFLAAQVGGADRAEAFAEALAWGAAAVRLPGSRMPGPDDIDRSAVRIVTEVAHERLSSITEGES
jgi:1-phosphofructokinase